MKLGEFNMLPIGAVLNNRYKITEQLGNHGYKYDYKAIDGKTQCMCVVSEFYMHSFPEQCANVKLIFYVIHPMHGIDNVQYI